MIWDKIKPNPETGADSEPSRAPGRNRISPEERALIDAAVAKGRVTHVPTGVSALEPMYRWVPAGKNQSGQLREIDEAGATQRPGAAWRKGFSAAARLVQSRNQSPGNR